MTIDREDWSSATPSDHSDDSIEHRSIDHGSLDRGPVESGPISFDYVDVGRPVESRRKPVGKRGGPARIGTAKTKSKPGRLARADFIGSSVAMKALREEIALFAEEDEPVLIAGETGSGKEAVATEIHRLSPRAAKPFLVRNVSGVSPELAGSEFFGHVKGAFTGAVDKREGVFSLADGGSLHLDEIGDLPFGVQAQLLRVLEDGVVTPVGGANAKTVDVRIIAATHVDLKGAVEKKTFREDLYHRLNVLRINVPPLRARGDDVIELAEYWLRKRAEKRGVALKLSAGAADALRAHAWPGNVRELRNIVTSAAVLARSGKISADHIRLDAQRSAGAESMKISDAKDLVARYLAAKALDRCGGNATKAAKMTGLGRSTFMMLKQSLSGGDQNAARLEAELHSVLGL
ncbi:MAG: sigma-54 dependent transcriptional regulator [Pseudomonadota bacterium]